MSPKSTHQKQLERARAKREAARRRVVRRERMRRGLIGALVVVILVGIAVPLVNLIRRPNSPIVDATPSASPAPSEGGGGVACGATRPAAADQPKPTYTARPEASLDPETTYRAHITTSCGEIVAEMFTAEAPVTAGNFIELARDGFFDGLTFHRVHPGFVIQGGDPDGTGAGGPGYDLPAELGLAVQRGYPPGTLAMAKAAAVSGSQFFITTVESFQPLEQRLYPVFAQVVGGMDVVATIEGLPVHPIGNDTFAPDDMVYIESITIEEVPAGTPSDGGSPT